jgi:hypothetical protein
LGEFLAYVASSNEMWGRPVVVNCKPSARDLL